MTGLRWTVDLGDDYLPVWRLHDDDRSVVAEVIPGDLPDGALGFVAIDPSGNEIAATLTRAGAQRAAEDWWDNACEDAYQARQEDVDAVTLRERAWMDHADSEILHDRKVSDDILRILDGEEGA